MSVGIDDQERKRIPTESPGKDEQDYIGETTVSSELPEKTNQQQSADKQGTYVEQISQPQEANAKATYAEKTDRIQAWVQFITAVAPFIWAIVILVVIIPLVGQLFIAKAFSPNTVTKETNHPLEVV